jgi:osmoprotectant transport system permease protein
MQLLTFWLSRRDELLILLAQHVVLVAAATVLAIFIGVPLGLLAAKRPKLGAPLVGVANIIQTIPSLAIFGFLIPLPLVGGIGTRSALVALVLYGLLPLIRTTAAGVRSIPRPVVEAGEALGMTPRQLLLQVEIPLALPQIVTGIKVAAVTAVGTATIAAAIGAGGLGEYIFRGLSMVNPTVILAGAIPAAALALLVDGALALVERRLTKHSGTSRWIPAAIGTAAVVVLLGAAVTLTRGRPEAIVVGSKNFTEQLLLGELVAQTIERRTDLPVERKLNLGGTFICDRALAAGDLDVYVEYTGTALTAIFKEPIVRDRSAALERVRERYARTGRTVMAPLGFNNTFAILVRAGDARRLGLRTISDAAAHSKTWRAGFGYEFLERKDGYTGLAQTYGLQFREPPRVMDLSLSYRALADGEVDFIAGDATAGLIEALDLAALEDDRRYFPPYDAVPVVSTATMMQHPELDDALATLAGRISEQDMRRMNAAVDVQRGDTAAVVRAFLDRLDKR